MAKTSREEILAAVKLFPAMSPAATRVLSLLGDPHTNASDIEEAVRYDPWLTATILKMANSAYFGFPGTIASITQAVAQLGWRRMFQLLITSTTSSVMDMPVPGYDLPKGELWRDAVAGSIAAEAITRERRIRSGDEAFTAALLRDVGKLVMGRFIAPSIRDVEATIARGATFPAAEREVLGTDHAEVGAAVLRNWLLPAGLANAVRWHHEPEEAEPRNVYVDIVHVADVIASTIASGKGHDDLKYEPSFTAMERLGLKLADLDMLANRTLQGMNELSEIMRSISHRSVTA